MALLLYGVFQYFLAIQINLISIKCYPTERLCIFNYRLHTIYKHILIHTDLYLLYYKSKQVHHQYRKNLSAGLSCIVCMS